VFADFRISVVGTSGYEKEGLGRAEESESKLSRSVPESLEDGGGLSERMRVTRRRRMREMRCRAFMVVVQFQ
jgi:hypothetical protein